MITKKKILSVIWDYLVLTLGTAMYCIAWDTFLIPNGIAAGGLTGACTVIQFATNGFIPMAYPYFVLNVTLLIVGVIVLGNAFGIKTVYAVLLSSFLFKIFPDYDWLQATSGHFFFIDNKALLPLVGGLLEAVGVGLIFKHGGSTGGTDILALVLNKFWPISPGKVYLYSDMFIIASVLLIPGKTFEDMIYGYIAMVTFSFMLDFVLLGSKSSVQVMVFTKKSEEMADYMMNELNRGVTALKAVGWYTKKENNVLLIVARRSQMPELSKAIKSIDDKAFVSVSPASSVYGEGFDEIKTGLSKKKKDKVADNA